MKVLRVTGLLLLVLFAIKRLDALYVRPDIESVPVERLIRNLEALVVTEPKNAQFRFNLARVHAMVFALKLMPSQSTEVLRGREAQGAWFGYEPTHVPFRAVAATDAAVQQVAREHLSKAIALYREAVELDPSNLTGKLGYAWCLDQSGDRAAAITAYRRVIADGWAIEQGYVISSEQARAAGPGGFQNLRGSPFIGPGFHSITVEAAGYLLPLLDPQKDKDEIATLMDRNRAMSMLPRAVTPLAVPLHDGLNVKELVDGTARVSFDADGSGLEREWTWMTPRAGWLVHAPQGSRPIRSALRLFGNVTFWLFWDNGYQALRALDDNGDGELRGEELRDLALWRDANANGKAEAGEVQPLSHWRIVSLSWKHESTPDRLDYVATSPRGVTFADGRTRPTWDILLHAREKRIATE